MSSDAPPKPPRAGEPDAQPDQPGEAARKQMAALLAAAPSLPDDHPTARALDLAVEAAERALEPFRKELPEAVYEQLVLELVGEVVADPALGALFEDAVPGAELVSGVRSKGKEGERGGGKEGAGGGAG